MASNASVTVDHRKANQRQPTAEVIATSRSPGWSTGGNPPILLLILKVGVRGSDLDVHGVFFLETPAAEESVIAWVSACRRESTRNEGAAVPFLI